METAGTWPATYRVVMRARTRANTGSARSIMASLAVIEART